MGQGVVVGGQRWLQGASQQSQWSGEERGGAKCLLLQPAPHFYLGLCSSISCHQLLLLLWLLLADRRRPQCLIPLGVRAWVSTCTEKRKRWVLTCLDLTCTSPLPSPNPPDNSPASTHTLPVSDVTPPLPTHPPTPVVCPCLHTAGPAGLHPAGLCALGLHDRFGRPHGRHLLAVLYC